MPDSHHVNVSRHPGNVAPSRATSAADHLLSHVRRLILQLTQHELSEDPHDLVAGYLLTLSKGLTAGGQLFGAAYLLTHGIIKLALVAALLKRRLWAYPAAIGIFALFAAYQVYRYTFTHSWYLILLTILDAVVIWLTWLEYTKVKVETM